MGEISNDKPAAVVPSGSRDLPGYQCLRSLSQMGVHTIYGEMYGGGSVASSRYCDEAVALPDPNEDLLAFKDALLDLAGRPDVRTIVPTNEYDAFVLSKFSEEFEPSVSLAVPPFDALHAVHDRIRLVDAAEAAGVPAPETWTLDEVPDWNRRLIVKSRYNLVTHDYDESYPADKATMPGDVRYLEHGEVPDREEMVSEMDHVPIVQECVPREAEYMVGALCDRGEPVATVHLHQIREDTYYGGGGVYRKSMYDPTLERVATDLLAELNWHGLACLEYMEDAETGEFKIAEINPRTWQSLGTSVRAGVDFPRYYWLLAMGRGDEIDPTPRLGVGSHLLQGELSYLRSVLREDSPAVESPNFYAALAEVLFVTLLEPNFDVLRFDDPGPFVNGVLAGMRQRLDSLGEDDSPTGADRLLRLGGLQ